MTWMCHGSGTETRQRQLSVQVVATTAQGVMRLVMREERWDRRSNQASRVNEHET